MDLVVDYDDININTKKTIKKEVRVFPSISFSISHIHYPTNNFSTDKIDIKVENKDYFLNFYNDHQSFFNNIYSKTFYAIAIDKEIKYFKKSIINLMQLVKGNDEELFEESVYEEEKRVFITNYTLVKPFIERRMDVEVYFVRHECSDKIEEMSGKLEFIVKCKKEPTERLKYFEGIRKQYALEKLEVNKAFLKFRSELINMTIKEKKTFIYKDPITKEVISPKLDILILNYQHIDDLWYGEIDNSTHVLNIKTLENFLQNKKKNLNEENIQFLSYLKLDEFKEDFIKLVGEKSAHLINNLFLDKQISVNFGKIKSFGELILTRNYFSRHCPGSLIFDKNFIPIGIASSQNNKLSMSNLFAHSDLNLSPNYNIVLPFFNTGVIYLFKKFLGIEVDTKVFFNRPPFVVDRSVKIVEIFHKNLNDFSDFELEYKKEKENTFPQIEDNIIDTNQEQYNNNSNFSKQFGKKTIIRRREISSYQNPHRDLSNPEEIVRMENYLKQKRGKFNFVPFNKFFQREEEEIEEICNLIDETINNIDNHSNSKIGINKSHPAEKNKKRKIFLVTKFNRELMQTEVDTPNNHYT